MLAPQDFQQLRRELDADRFIDMARQRTGLSDFGGSDFCEALNKLLDCAARDAAFHAQGLEAFKGDIVRSLCNRLRMQQDIARYPEILDEDVSDPIIVVGLGRSGTTKLHKMLSAQDQVQKTLFWRLWNPAPFPDAMAGQLDPRIGAVGTSQLLSADNPVMDAAHRIAEQEVEEEWFLYTFTFADWMWCQMIYLPSYFDWTMLRPSLGAYRYVKTMLQYLQWQDGGKRGRPWILKSVGHIANMEALLDCYPRATLVHPHRDPHDTIPSFAKLLSSSWPLYGKPVEPHLIGAEVMRQWGTATRRYLESRDRLGLDGRILDVDYEQVRSDPMPLVREIYRRANRVLSPAEAERMAAWHAGNEQGRHGRHEYSLQEFGLDEAAIDKTFGDYIRRFIKRS